MQFKCTTFNTFPSKKDSFWQVVLIPTISVLNSISRDDKYIALNFEWLFWSLTTIFENDSKR
jgi:hypothetical protein